MSFKILLLPPEVDESRPEKIRQAVPGAVAKAFKGPHDALTDIEVADELRVDVLLLDEGRSNAARTQPENNRSDSTGGPRALDALSAHGSARFSSKTSRPNTPGRCSRLRPFTMVQARASNFSKPAPTPGVREHPARLAGIQGPLSRLWSVSGNRAFIRAFFSMVNSSLYLPPMYRLTSSSFFQHGISMS